MYVGAKVGDAVSVGEDDGSDRHPTNRVATTRLAATGSEGVVFRRFG